MRFQGLRNRARLLTAVYLSILLTLTACGSEASQDLTASVELTPPVGTWADESSSLDTLSLSAEPVWTSADHSELQPNSDVDFVGDVIVLRSGGVVSVLDAATGTQKWSISPGTELPGTGGAKPESSAKVVSSTESSADGVIVIDYKKDNCDSSSGPCEPPDGEPLREYGVAALSVTDGSVLWMTPITPDVVPAGEDDDIGMSLNFADATTALVSVAPSEAMYGTESVPVEEVHAIALDVATGAVSWTSQGLWPVAAAGDNVLAVAGGMRPRGAASVTMTIADGDVVGLDRATGASVWDYPAEGVSDVVLTVGDRALVRSGSAEGDVGSAYAVIDPSTGDAVADLGPALSWCATDEVSQVSCTLGGDGTAPYHVVTFDADTSEVSVGATAPPEKPTPVSGVADGYIFVGGWGIDEAQYALDPTGADTSGPLPGRLRAMSDKYAVFATFSPGTDPAPTGFVVYERTS